MLLCRRNVFIYFRKVVNMYWNLWVRNEPRYWILLVLTRASVSLCFCREDQLTVLCSATSQLIFCSNHKSPYLVSHHSDVFCLFAWGPQRKSSHLCFAAHHHRDPLSVWNKTKQKLQIISVETKGVYLSHGEKYTPRRPNVYTENQCQLWPR